MEARLAGRTVVQRRRSAGSGSCETALTCAVNAARYEVDALSGATFTTRGVKELVNFWAGDLGFGPFLQKLKAQQMQASVGGQH